MNAPSSDAPASEWLVYADSLQQQGQPLGEFIVLVNTGDAAKRDAWLAKNAPSILGEAARHLGETLTLEWKWGFIDKATVRSGIAADVLAVVGALLPLPVSQRLSTLAVVGVPGENDTALDLSDVTAKLAEQLPAGVALELVDDRAANATSLTSRDFDPDNNLVNFGTLTPLWRSARALKLVVADVRQVELGVINAPHLESLTIHGLRLAGQAYGEMEPCEAVTSLGEGVMPRLKHFDMRLNEEWTVNHVDDDGAYTAHDSFPEDEFDTGYSEGANWQGEFGVALRALKKCPLETLTLTNFASTGSLLELVAEVGLPASLRVLDLSQSSLSTADVAWFNGNKALLSKLDKLVVRETGFTEDDVKTLRTLVKEVDFTPGVPPPRPEWDDEGEGEEREPEVPLPKYRYIVGME